VEESDAAAPAIIYGISVRYGDILAYGNKAESVKS